MALRFWRCLTDAYTRGRRHLLGQVFDAYCSKIGLMREEVRFLFDGQRVLAQDTPATFEMEENDALEAKTEELGD